MIITRVLPAFPTDKVRAKSQRSAKPQEQKGSMSFGFAAGVVAGQRF